MLSEKLKVKIRIKYKLIQEKITYSGRPTVDKSVYHFINRPTRKYKKKILCEPSRYFYILCVFCTKRIWTVYNVDRISWFPLLKN